MYKHQFQTCSAFNYSDEMDSPHFTSAKKSAMLSVFNCNTQMGGAQYAQNE